MLSSQMITESEQEIYLVTDDLFRQIITASQNPRCAWCLCEQGIDLGSGSHGICALHADQMRRQLRSRRAAEDRLGRMEK
jgi:hypothetical protein